MKRTISVWLKASFALFAVSVVGATVAAFSLASYEPGTQERCEELGKLLSSNQYTAADKEEYSKYCGPLPQMYPAAPVYQSISCDDLKKIMDSGQYSADQKAQWANCQQAPQDPQATEPLRTCDDLKKLIDSGNATPDQKDKWANCLAGKSDAQPTAPTYTCDEIKKIIDSGNYNSDQKLLWLNCQQGYRPVPVRPMPARPQSSAVPCDELKRMVESGKFTPDQEAKLKQCQQAPLDISSVCNELLNDMKKYDQSQDSSNYANVKNEYNNLCINDETGESLMKLPPYTANVVCDEAAKALSSDNYTSIHKKLIGLCNSRGMSGVSAPATGDQMREECERLRVTLEKYSANPDSQEYTDTKAKYVKTCYRQEQNVRTPQAMPATTATQRPANFIPEDQECKDLRNKILTYNKEGMTDTKDYANLKETFKKLCEKSEKSKFAPPAGYEEEVLVNPDAYNNPFPDTDANGREGKAAAELYRRGVLGGFPDGEFKGMKPVNRAEAAKFLLLACGKDTQADFSGKFRDLMKGQWYVPYVEAAARLGIIKGYEDGTFRPANTVNRAEFSKMITLACQLPVDLDHSLFTDVKDGDWFATYAGAVQKYSLYPDSVVDNLFKPANLMTRSEVAIAIYQYLTNR